MSWQPVESLPRAWQADLKPVLCKQSCSDFVVEEILQEMPCGEGEHSFLQVRKTDANTLWVAEQLARYAGVKAQDVGHAGLKDRQAVTTQWLSVPIRPDQPDWRQLALPGVEILQVIAHRRKLRVGELAGNRFSIILRDLAVPEQALQPVLANIAAHGVPNYFMEQRFGHGLGNLDKAMQLFARTLKASPGNKGLYLSAARSYLFNAVLASRVEQHCWRQAISGDLQLTEAGEVLPVAVTDELQSGLTGPLWGRGRLASTAVAAELELAAVQPYPEFTNGLEHAGLSQERRLLQLRVQDWQALWLDKAVLQLSFRLPPGAYATAVIREIGLHTQV